MAPDRTKQQPGAGEDHSANHRRLTDAYHRQGSQPDTAARVFVLIFEDVAHQFHCHRGDSQADIAARLREFADRLDQ